MNVRIGYSERLQAYISFDGSIVRKLPHLREWMVREDRPVEITTLGPDALSVARDFGLKQNADLKWNQEIIAEYDIRNSNDWSGLPFYEVFPSDVVQLTLQQYADLPLEWMEDDILLVHGGNELTFVVGLGLGKLVACYINRPLKEAGAVFDKKRVSVVSEGAAIWVTNNLGWQPRVILMEVFREIAPGLPELGIAPEMIRSGGDILYALLHTRTFATEEERDYMYHLFLTTSDYSPPNVSDYSAARFKRFDEAFVWLFFVKNDMFVEGLKLPLSRYRNLDGICYGIVVLQMLQSHLPLVQLLPALQSEFGKRLRAILQIESRQDLEQAYTFLAYLLDRIPTGGFIEKVIEAVARKLWESEDRERVKPLLNFSLKASGCMWCRWLYVEQAHEMVSLRVDVDRPLETESDQTLLGHLALHGSNEKFPCPNCGYADDTYTGEIYRLVCTNPTLFYQEYEGRNLWKPQFEYRGVTYQPLIVSQHELVGFAHVYNIILQDDHSPVYISSNHSIFPVQPEDARNLSRRGNKTTEQYTDYPTHYTSVAYPITQPRPHYDYLSDHFIFGDDRPNKLGPFKAKLRPVQWLRKYTKHLIDR